MWPSVVPEPWPDQLGVAPPHSQVRILLPTSDGNGGTVWTHACGGSLISPTAVLTGWHCAVPALWQHAASAAGWMGVREGGKPAALPARPARHPFAWSRGLSSAAPGFTPAWRSWAADHPLHAPCPGLSLPAAAHCVVIEPEGLLPADVFLLENRGVAYTASGVIVHPSEAGGAGAGGAGGGGGAQLKCCCWPRVVWWSLALSASLPGCQPGRQPRTPHVAHASLQPADLAWPVPAPPGGSQAPGAPPPSLTHQAPRRPPCRLQRVCLGGVEPGPA